MSRQQSQLPNQQVHNDANKKRLNIRVFVTGVSQMWPKIMSKYQSTYEQINRSTSNLVAIQASYKSLVILLLLSLVTITLLGPPYNALASNPKGEVNKSPVETDSVNLAPVRTNVPSFASYALPPLTFNQGTYITSPLQGASAFAESIDIDGNRLIVGAYGASSATGAAYIFEWDGTDWVQMAELEASDGTTNDTFGYSVDISENHAIVGARRNDTTKGTDSGLAYIFELNGTQWGENCTGVPLTCQETQKLDGSDIGASTLFGTSVAIDQDRAIVGAPGADIYPVYAGIGRAYIFERNQAGEWGTNCDTNTPTTCEETQRIDPSSGDSYDNFGSGVDISGNNIIVGSNTTSAFIFERNDSTGEWGQSCTVSTPATCEETQRIKASDALTYGFFGGKNSLAISDNYAIVGHASYNDPSKGANSGAAYIFERNQAGEWGTDCDTGIPATCEEAQRIEASDGETNDFFGYAVDIQGDHVIVGTYVKNTNTGAAYIFERNQAGEWGTDCDTNSPATCEESQPLQDNNGGEGDNFGWSVAISDNYAFVGAPGRPQIVVFNYQPPEDLSISGRVAWTESGNPISGVTVEARQGGNVIGSDTTDSNDGTYQITGLPSGQYELIASRVGYRFQPEDLNVLNENMEFVVDVQTDIIDQNFLGFQSVPVTGFKGAGWLNFDFDYESGHNIGWNLEFVNDLVLENVWNGINNLKNNEHNINTLVRLDVQPPEEGAVVDQVTVEYETCAGLQNWMDELDSQYLSTVRNRTDTSAIPIFILNNEPNHTTDEGVSISGTQYSHLYNCYYQRWRYEQLIDPATNNPLYSDVGRPHHLFVAGPGQFGPGPAGTTNVGWGEFLNEMFPDQGSSPLDDADGFAMHVYGYYAELCPNGQGGYSPNTQCGDVQGTLFQNWFNTTMSRIQNHPIAGQRPILITEYNPGAAWECERDAQGNPILDRCYPIVNQPPDGWQDWFDQTCTWMSGQGEQLRGILYFVDEEDFNRSQNNDGRDTRPLGDWWAVSLNNAADYPPQRWPDDRYPAFGSDEIGDWQGRRGFWLNAACPDLIGQRQSPLSNLYASIGDITLQTEPKDFTSTQSVQANLSIGGIISGTLGRRGYNDIYNVTTNLELPVGETLTIVPGTTLVFSTGQEMSIAGQLIAEGNAIFPIRFVSDGAAGWDGLHFLPSALESRCIGCWVENLSIGGTALQVEAPIAFQESRIRDVPAGTAISSTIPFTLTNVVIDYVDTGLRLSNQMATTYHISHLTISRCQRGVVNQGQSLTLDNSIFTTCGVAISTSLSGTTTVSYTLLHNLDQDFETETGSQLILGSGLLIDLPKFVNFPADFHLLADSPAVNAADPLADYSREPGYNGERADLGAYGNTSEATESPPLNQMAVTISTDTPDLTAPLGQLVTRTVTLTNSGQITDVYMITIRGSNVRFQASLFAEGYDSPRSFVLGPGTTIDLTIWERQPLNSTLGMSNTFTVQAVGAYGVVEEVELTISLPSFQEVGGQLALEAENFMGRTTRSGHTWLTQTVVSGYIGSSYLKGSPDTDLQFTAGYTTSPEVQYAVNITTTGTYYVWLRGYAPNGASDSVYIGLDNQPSTTLTGFSPRTWGWANSNPQGDLATLDITTPGVHQLHLWQREDGIRVDRIVLTTDSGYTPTGSGPPESKFE